MRFSLLGTLSLPQSSDFQIERSKHEQKSRILDHAPHGDQARRHIDECLCEAACARGEDIVSLAVQIELRANHACYGKP